MATRKYQQKRRAEQQSDTRRRIVVAVVALSEIPEDTKQVETDLRALCREHLAPYEVPAHFEFVDKLPRSALGKLLKRDLIKPPAQAPAEELMPHNGPEVA